MMMVLYRPRHNSWPTVKATNSQEQQVAPESMSVHVFGKTAIATGVFRAKGVEAGKRYVRRERFVDTWLFSAGNGCVSPLTPRQFSTESCKGHTMYPES